MGEWLRRMSAVFVGVLLALIVAALLGFVLGVGLLSNALSNVTSDIEPIPTDTYDPDLEPEPESWPTEP